MREIEEMGPDPDPSLMFKDQYTQKNEKDERKEVGEKGGMKGVSRTTREIIDERI